MKKQLFRTMLVALIGLWAVAAATKAMSFREFARTVNSLRLVPELEAPLLARAVIAAEVAIVLMLAFPRLRAAGLLGSQGMLAAFAGVQAWRWVAAIKVPCNCFGPLYKITPLSSLGLIAPCSSRPSRWTGRWPADSPSVSW